MNSKEYVEWDVAEVLEYDYTYQYNEPGSDLSNTDRLFALKVKSCSRYFDNKVYMARPADMNMKRIPLVGEFVLMFKTFNEQSTSNRWRKGWYYVSTIDLQSSINENRLPGISDGLTQEQIDAIKPGKTFTSKTISPLQPYEGDMLLEGRWGNSIRFGSSINTTYPAGYYYKSTPWPSNQDGDPIIVLSNGRNNKSKKEFTVENAEQDASSLYLTSTQRIDTLKLTKNLTVHNGAFAGSQFVGVADRVILRAKSDIAVIDSQEAIVLNTPNEIYIGGEDATEPLAHGLVLQQILQLIVQAIAAGSTGPGGAPCVTNASALLSQISTLLPDLNSTKYKMTKT